MLVAGDTNLVMRHHRAAWRAERIGWFVMALVLTATVLGGFGDGPLSRAKVHSDTGWSLEYERLVRSNAPSLFRFHVQPGLAAAGEVQLRLDRSLLDHMEIESIVPSAAREVTGPGYGEFTFLLAPGEKAATIDLRYRPATFGHRRGRVSLSGGQPVFIDQFAFP